MPVPTDTYWNIKKLNYLFAFAGVLLAVSTGVLIVVDGEKKWRDYQRANRVWETAMTEDAARNAIKADKAKELAALKERLAELKASLNKSDEIKALQVELAKLQEEKAARELKAAVDKGEIGPLIQQVERAKLEHGEGSDRVKQLQKKLADTDAKYNAKFAELTAIGQKIAATTAKMDKLRADAVATQKKIDDIERAKKTEEEKLAKVNPQGLAKLSEEIRNKPLSDWMNPSIKPLQVVTADIRTPLNFLDTETIDRCMTCHVNIDQPRYEENTLIAFAERQVALKQGQDVNSVDKPAVMLDFWLRTARVRGAQAEGKGLLDGLKELEGKTLAAINANRKTANQKPIDEKQGVYAAIDGVLAQADVVDRSKTDDKGKPVEVMILSRAEAYKPVAYFVDDLRELIRKNVGEEDYKLLKGLYRHALVDEFNKLRKTDGEPALSANAALLAHPNLELYVEPDSKHPMKTFGCTSCHEGAGGETDFTHATHVPREMWVDAKSGAPVPKFLIAAQGGGAHAAASPKQKTNWSLDGAQVALASEKAGDPHAGGAVYTHNDVKITDPGNPEPFAPERDEAHGKVAYHNPGLKEEVHPEAVQQDEYWTKRYGWEEVHYMHWEKPMNRLDFTQSSCMKCHTEVYDVEHAAPQLFEGRKLFAQLGCVNCHEVKQLADQLDVKKVGPSLVNVHEKLSSEMMASWIWSPRAFRPTTRMPHFFMLENNSTPVDIARTRVETAAMTYYLQNAPTGAAAKRDALRVEAGKLQKELGATTNEARKKDIEAKLTKLADDITTATASIPAYKPEPAPEAAGDAKHGKELFNSVGCLACHTNLNEHGEKWISEDLVKRTGVSLDDAKKQFKEMGYQKQHWYALEHLQSKLVLVGPELSGVGTKLKAGRDPKQAKAWLYDWLRQPRHYSSYTIMPSFRLSESEANDLTAYLLSQERPDYTPDEFVYHTVKNDKGETTKELLTSPDRAMLEELVVVLKAGQVTRQNVRDMIHGKAVDPATGQKQEMSVEDQLMFLGKKMIGNYGCNGCHAINGFEDVAATPCAELSAELGWGLKDPHKLDFGYFDGAFDKQREKPEKVWKVKSEGLTADAPHIGSKLADGKADPHIHQVDLEWEHMGHERRPWLYHKLHNTRVYDRGRVEINSPYTDVAAAIKAMESKSDNIVGRPYDKLKMPKFFLTDEQVRSLVTFVTAIRTPLVSQSIQKAAYKNGKWPAARGKQVATLYNCYGCHNIEGNEVHIHEFYDVWKPDGTKDVAKLNEVAPPRLVGQGSRTQPEWLHHFLLNVEPLRPWLKVRMPSFPMDGKDATYIADYFAGHSQVMAAKLAPAAKEIADFKKTNPNVVNWYDAPTLAKRTNQIKDFAVHFDLAPASAFDPRQTTEDERRETWAGKFREGDPPKDEFGQGPFREKIGAVDSVQFLAGLNSVEYPFPAMPTPKNISEERYARGQTLYNELKCYQCHALGDESKLLDAWKLNNAALLNKPAKAAASDDDDYGTEEKKPAKKDEKKSDDDGYGEEEEAPKPAPPPVGPVYTAPNLGRVAKRLQWNWVDHWLMEPNTIQPGTKMPRWFPAGDSAYKQYGEEMDMQFRPKYGWLGRDQIQLLMDYVYAAGMRGDTHYDPAWTKLPPGVQPPAKVELQPIPRPPKPQVESFLSAIEPKKEGDTKAGDGGKTKDTKPSADDHGDAAIELHDGSQAFKGTRVVGVIKLDGKLPRAREIDMSADAVCGRANKDAVVDPMNKINPDDTLPNVLVYVKSGLPEGQKFEVPKDPVVIDQQGCMFHPFNAGAMVGQRVRYLNNDATLHNIKTKYGNDGMPVKGMKIDKVYTKPDLFDVKCDVHPWMSAYVHVFPHPFFATTNSKGQFELKGLPPGKYTLEAWHPLAESKSPVAPVTFEVEVKADTSVRADAVLKK